MGCQYWLLAARNRSERNCLAYLKDWLTVKGQGYRSGFLLFSVNKGKEDEQTIQIIFHFQPEHGMLGHARIWTLFTCNMLGKRGGEEQTRLIEWTGRRRISGSLLVCCLLRVGSMVSSFSSSSLEQHWTLWTRTFIAIWGQVTVTNITVGLVGRSSAAGRQSRMIVNVRCLQVREEEHLNRILVNWILSTGKFGFPWRFTQKFPTQVKKAPSGSEI